MKLPGQSSRRTEEIRRRRNSVVNPKPANAKQRKSRVSAPPLPPVMARTPIAGVSRPVYSRNKRGRRMYNVSLDAAHGTEMSLPSLPKVVLGWRLISLMIVAGLGFALYMIWESPSFRVDAPQIAGLSRLNVTQVNMALGLTGELVFALDEVEIRSNLLESFPEFSAAEVEIELPNTVLITVTERVPVLAWVYDGESVLVDEQGITFPMRDATYSGSYPVVEASGSPPQVGVMEQPDLTVRDATISKITGVLLPQLSPKDQVRPLLSPEMVKAVLLLSEKGPTGVKLIYDPVHGLGWTDRRGWNVYLGNEDEIETKLQVYRSIMEHLKAQESLPTVINIQYLHAPFYRLEE